MGLKLLTVPVTTDSSGDASVEVGPIDGAIYQVRYVPDGSTPLATGADLDIVGALTGVVVANHDDIGTSAFTKVYTMPASSADGADLTETGDHFRQHPVLSHENALITIANGGDTKSGTFYLWVTS